MACEKLPVPSLPTLPSPFSLEPPELDPLDASLDICCKFVSLHLSLALPISAVLINPGVVALLNEAFDAVETWLDQFELDCPLH